MGALMIQGVSSGVGKSLITTAIARAFHRRGIDTAPFKAQNIANNARVVDGGEIGAAQYMQALAACVEPDVRMNPVRASLCAAPDAWAYQGEIVRIPFD